MKLLLNYKLDPEHLRSESFFNKFNTVIAETHSTPTANKQWLTFFSIIAYKKFFLSQNVWK